MLWDASGSLRMYADDERSREVGQTHSTGEVSEQGRATGGGSMLIVVDPKMGFCPDIASERCGKCAASRNLTFKIGPRSNRALGQSPERSLPIAKLRSGDWDHYSATIFQCDS
jgi:hypothetical protein